MLRLVKKEGARNVMLEDAEIPAPARGQTAVRIHKTLISRGPELYGRYIREEEVAHQRMGYSATGIVHTLGAAVEGFSVGDRVVAVAPHAEYALVDLSKNPTFLVHLPEQIGFEQGTFLPLIRSSVVWVENAQIQKGETVVILEQGLVGALYLQVAKLYQPGLLVAVDALPIRCQIVTELGADEVINVSEVDSVQAVRELTGGMGADVVIEAVGGSAGPRAFSQALDMVRTDGRILIIGLYQGEPLPLDSSKAMRMTIKGGNVGYDHERTLKAIEKSLDLLIEGKVRVERMITHRFKMHEVPSAFDLLYHHPDSSLGVIISWTGEGD